MSNQQTLDDLSYATALAKSGSEAPLIGGPIGLMWGILLSTTLLTHWAIITGVLAVRFQYLWLLWIMFSLLGGFGSALLGKRIATKTGAQSMANRVERAVWSMFTLMLACLWVGIVISMLLGMGSVAMFDLVPIVGFAGQGLAYGVTAKISHHKWLAWASGAAFLASMLCLPTFGQPMLYLIAAIATVFTVVLPSLKTIGFEHASQ